jgi:hypothetical protein
VTVPLEALVGGDGGPDGATADAGADAPRLQPGSVSFGGTVPPAAAHATLHLRNPRSTPLTYAISLEQPDGGFALGAGTTCMPPQPLGAGGSCALTIDFQPSQRMAYHATLRVSYAGGQAAAALDGRGVAWLVEPAPQTGGATPSLYSVWAPAADDVWAGADHTALLQRQGGVWIAHGAPAGATLLSGLWGSSAEDFYGITSSIPHVYHTTNGGVSSDDTTLSVTGALQAINGSATGDVWVATSAGEIEYRTGGQWSADRTSGGEMLTALWATSANDVYAVGRADVILHRTGGAWRPLPASTPPADHDGVWSSSPSDVYVVGCDTLADAAACGLIKHSDGDGSFTQLIIPAAPELLAVWGSGPADVFAVGRGGVVLHFDGSGWSREPSNATADLRAISGAGGEVFAVGDSGTIIHRY